MNLRWRRRPLLLDVEGGHIRYIRVAMGGVGTKPWRSHEAEAALMGKSANEATFKAAAEAALARPSRTRTTHSKWSWRSAAWCAR